MNVNNFNHRDRTAFDGRNVCLIKATKCCLYWCRCSPPDACLQCFQARVVDGGDDVWYGIGKKHQSHDDDDVKGFQIEVFRLIVFFFFRFLEAVNFVL